MKNLSNDNNYTDKHQEIKKPIRRSDLLPTKTITFQNLFSTWLVPELCNGPFDKKVFISLKTVIREKKML